MTSTLTTSSHLGEMAVALLGYDALLLRLYVQAWLRERPRFALMPKPETDDPRILVAAAALVELLAGRFNQLPPTWTTSSGSLGEPIFCIALGRTPRFHPRSLPQRVAGAVEAAQYLCAAQFFGDGVSF